MILDDTDPWSEECGQTRQRMIRPAGKLAGEADSRAWIDGAEIWSTEFPVGHGVGEIE